jgi:hypothetical protein
VLQDVDQAAERIAHGEAAHAPGSRAGPYSTATPASRMRASAASRSSTSIESCGTGVPAPPSAAMPTCTAIRCAAP